MKVLLCSYYKGTVGGISRWTHHILEYYHDLDDKNGIILDIFSLSRSTDIYTDTSIFKRLIYGFTDYIRIIRNFKKVISKGDYDIVHLVSSASFGLIRDLLMLRILRSFNLKSVIHFRFGRIPDLYHQDNWEKKLLNLVVKSADKIIVIDKASFDTLLGQGYANIVYIPNPINQSVLDFVDKHRNIIRDKSKIVFAGHVIKTKGVFELVKVAKRLKGISVDIIGHVSEENKTELNKAIGEDNARIKIKGQLDYENTLKHMLSAGIFVLPTYTEGFPNVILESMACSCPIVASSVGAIPEMLNMHSIQKCGICVSPKNVDELEQAINKMLDDPNYAKLCGDNAHTRVKEEYSIPKIWNELKTLWSSLK